ncbi:MAG: hypothetical protein COB03_03110 [Alteromonas sp.]|nr:MAG: hypothetical protein COB03_03110 [Alteromonas sp.]
MTNVYNTGTVSVPSNSNIVTGIDTYFQSVGNISEGDLFTLDGKEFYEIYQIDTDSQLRIKHRLSGDTYAGDAVSDVSYSIIQSFATDSIAEIAKNVVLLQQNWHRREDEMTGWFNTNNNYYQITNQQGERVLVVTPTGLTKLVDGTIDIGDGSALAELAWANIQNIPETASRWARFDEITDKPDYAQGWPNFENVTGKVTQEQLPDSIETDSKRTQALSPPVKIEPSLSHRLIDYPKLKKTVDIPTHSPNNRREMLFDDVRQVAYIALTEEWLKIPNVIATREFLVKTSSTRLYFDSNYTGSLTLRVYPMGEGGTGLPDNPTLSDFEWHTVTSAVTNLGQFASGFIGIIDYIETDSGFETLSAAKSHFQSVGVYHGNSDGSVANNRFMQFSLRQDGYWYSADVMPETPYSMGGSWSQDTTDSRLFSVAGADGGSDALRIFGDSWDEYEFEIVVVTDIPNPMALTVGNNADYTTYFEGTYRFIVEQDRFYFKRQASFAPLTGSVRIESLRLRVAHYE